MSNAKRKECYLEILYLRKLHFKNKEEIKSFLDEGKQYNLPPERMAEEHDKQKSRRPHTEN